MPDTTNQINVSGNEVINTTVFPDTKLQSLDRRVGKDQLFFDRRLFEVTVGDWSGKPIIFQPDGIHPTDFAAVNRDPISAAEAIGGKLVGSVTNPRIVIPGGPRLMAELDINDDEGEIVRLWQEGKLFPSTAFTASSDGDRLTSPPVPNHVLLFPVEVDKVVPGDSGAFVNTLEVSEMKTEKDDEKKKACSEQAEEPTQQVVNAEQSDLDAIKERLDTLEAEVATLKEKAENQVTNSADVTEEAAANALENVNAEIKWRDESIAELKAEVEALKAGKAALEEELAGMKKATAEAELNSIIEQLPVGMKSTPEQVEDIRAKYQSGNMLALLHSVLASHASTGSTEKVGQPFTQSNIAETQVGPGDLNKPRTRKE